MHGWRNLRAIEATSRRWFRRRHLLWWGVVLAAALLAGWWWCTRVPSFRLDRYFATHDILLLASTTGFMVRSGALTYNFYDWTGVRRWQVTAATSVFPQGGSPTDGTAFSLSPNGHFFAATSITHQQLRVQSWHDGVPRDDIILPTAHFPSQRTRVHALDNGTIFAWLPWHERTPAFAVRDARVIARGAFLPYGVLSSDGITLVARDATGGFTYATVTIRDGAIRLTNRYHASDTVTTQSLISGYVANYGVYNNGVVLTDNGARYTSAGRIAFSSEWRQQTMAPGGMYTLQSTAHLSRVYSPVTGDTWSFRVPDINLGGDATSDGRFALAWASVKLPDSLADLVQRLSLLGPLSTPLAREYLALYERPGTLRAMLHINHKAWWPEAHSVDGSWWYPAPDGRTIVFTLSINERARCLVFRR